MTVVVVVTLITMALAAFYATKTSTEGKLPLIAAPREWFVERWGVYADDADKTMPICRTTDPREDDKRRTNLVMRTLAYGLECPWCSGFWWSCVVALITPLPPLLPVWLVAFALAAVVGILSETVSLVAEGSTRLQHLNKQK